MLDNSYTSLIKTLVIGALILVMAFGGAVAITPRYFSCSDVGICHESTGYDWLAIFVVVPFVVGVALAVALLKLWLKNRRTETPDGLP